MLSSEQQALRDWRPVEKPLRLPVQAGRRPVSRVIQVLGKVSFPTSWALSGLMAE